MVGVAVKVAFEPAHIGLVPVVKAMETDGTTTGFTVMLIAVDVAVVGVAQLALEVMMQVTF